MIKEIVKTEDRREVTLLRPETKADVEEIERQRKAGELDASESMGDRDDDDEQDLIDAGILLADE